MTLTRAHPGVIRFERSLWLVNPTAGDPTRLRRHQLPRGSERIISFVVVVAVFTGVFLLEKYTPLDVKRRVLPWVSYFDVDNIFGGLLVILAIVILIVIAWLAYRGPDHDPIFLRKQVVPLGVFESVGARVTDAMPWDGLWRLARSLEKLDDEYFAAVEATQRNDDSAARRSRRIAKEQLVEAATAAGALGITVDLSFYTDTD